VGLRELWSKLTGRSPKPEPKPTPDDLVAERQRELLDQDEKRREGGEADRQTTP
jgi:hypothetical protein